MRRLSIGLVGSVIAGGLIGLALSGEAAADHMTGRCTMVPQDPRTVTMAGGVLRIRQAEPTLQAQISGPRFSAQLQGETDGGDNARSQAWQQQQRVQSGLAQQYSQYIRGVETHVDRISGERVELASGHGQAWSNGRGECILSNDTNFNPSIAFRERWEEMPRLERPR